MEQNNRTDAMGHALIDFLNKGKAKKLWIDSNIAETDEIPVSYLFRDLQEMPPIEQKALQACRGKIFDVGAGAGSHSLWLQNKGFSVTALEISDMACEVMKQRGVIDIINNDFFACDTSQKFDTLLFLMNGIGLTGHLEYLPTFFDKCKQLLAPGGQLLLDSSDLIYMYGDEEEGYAIDLNGAYYGEVEYVMRYGNIKSNPFYWLFVDPATLINYAKQEGFTCEIILEGNHFDYLACLKLQ